MARSSDQIELDRLVTEHLPSALRFATRLTGDIDAAEEVVQEALVRVARSWKTFRGEARFQTWLFQIVINVFRSRCHATRDPTVRLSGEIADTQVARVIGRIDGAATTQRLIMMVELGVNRHEACIALLSSRGREATQFVNAAAERDPTLAAILSGARLFTQLDNPPRS
jgi:RNA polymerase sigma-70 factor (ECF subfamily)